MSGLLSQDRKVGLALDAFASCLKGAEARIYFRRLRHSELVPSRNRLLGGARDIEPLRLKPDPFHRFMVCLKAYPDTKRGSRRRPPGCVFGSLTAVGGRRLGRSVEFGAAGRTCIDPSLRSG